MYLMYINIKGNEVSMKIHTIDSINFGIKFRNNYALMEIEDYARRINRKDELDKVLTVLKQDNSEDIVTINLGQEANNKVFSNFVLNGTRVINSPYDGENALETTYRALLDLANFGGRYRALTNNTRLFRPYGE